MSSQRLFTQTKLSPQQVNTIARIKQDPNFSNSEYDYLKIKNGRDDKCCLIADGDHAFKFLSKNAEITKENPSYVDFVNPNHFVTVERRLVVNGDGSIDIYDADKKVSESLYDYLFSEAALQLIRALHEKPLFHPSEMTNTDVAIFNYRSKHLKNVTVPKDSELNHLNLRVADYTLYVRRDAKMEYTLQYVSKDNRLGLSFMDDIQSVPDPTIVKFHKKHLQPILDELSKDTHTKKLCL